jgi:hypothetical protein
MYEWMRKLITVDQSTSPKIRRRRQPRRPCRNEISCSRDAHIARGLARRREVDVTAEKSRVCRIRWVFHFRNLTRIFETSAFA